MEVLAPIKALSADLGLMPLYDALRWWYWSTKIHLWYLPYTALLIVELLIGRRERATWREVLHNYAFVTIWVTIFAAMTPAMGAFVRWNTAVLGGPYIDLTFGAGDGLLPNVAAQVIYVFIFDFFYYWWHRLQHEIPVLWVTHKLHHVDQNMGVTTTMKSHPVTLIGRTVVVALPMALLFNFEPTTIFLVSYTTRIYEHFVHANINCHYGWLNCLISSPNQHRVHHSTLPEHRNKNFATYFPIIDVVFGTYCAPGSAAPPTGIESGEKYETLWKAYMQPFTDWWQMGKTWANAASR